MIQRVPREGSRHTPCADLDGTRRVPTTLPRDAALRDLYLSAAWTEIPRLLGAIDRNPFRPTYGCLDRQYWHYRTSSFPSQMYQEGALALAMVVRLPLPGNRWHADPRVRDLAVAALRFSVRSSHADGSCDDYYPFERALGAAVFSLQASARAVDLLGLDDPEILAWLRRRADWLTRHQESGRLANHHALAALGLLRVAQLTGQSQYQEAAQEAIGRVIQWQSAEGWFDEYGGADPGYQTVTIDCLAKYRHATGDPRLDEPLGRAVDFARHFLHPDQSYGGEYGSRGTYHFYPHGMELLAAAHPAAADLADGILVSLRTGACAHFADDRMFTHRLANLIEAYVDWAPHRVVSPSQAGQSRYFPRAQILVVRDAGLETVVSAARGGVFKHFGLGPAITDAGLLVETDAGLLAASQWHDLGRQVNLAGQYPDMDSPPLPPEEGRGEGNPPKTGQLPELGCAEQRSLDTAESLAIPPHPCPLPEGEGDHEPFSLSVVGPLYWCRADVANPLTQSLLHVGMWLAGRWFRTLVRRLLQRRLITGRRTAPIRLTRTLCWRWLPLPFGERVGVREATEDEQRPAAAPSMSRVPGWTLRVTDVIELCDPRLVVRRMAFGTDHQMAYVAASGVYQDSVLRPWTDLAEKVADLNANRRVVVQRQF